MDKFTAYETITDRFGKEHKIYPARLKFKEEIRRLTVRFNDENIIANILNLKLDGEGMPEVSENGDLQYDDKAFDALMDIVYLALDEKETKEDILEWIDIVLVKEIIRVFYDLSN